MYDLIKSEGAFELSEKETSKNMKYTFKIPKDRKEIFIMEALKKGYKVESVIQGQFNMSEHFVELENR